MNFTPMVQMVKARQRKNGLVFGTSKQGFTLIELLIVIVILGIMAAVIVPNLGSRRPQEERNVFISKLNALMQFAWQNALLTNKLHKVVFDFKNRTIFLEQIADKQKGSKTRFEPLQRAYIATTITWPAYLQIKNFIIEGFDEMKRSASGKTDQSWFFIVPGGTTQRVTINMIDMHDAPSKGHSAKIGLVLNPFKAQFVVYDTFKK